MAVNPGWRNQHTTLDAIRAKSRIQARCMRCGTGLDRKKKYCLPCANARYDETVAANRAKYKALRSIPPRSSRPSPASKP